MKIGKAIESALDYLAEFNVEPTSLLANANEFAPNGITLCACIAWEDAAHFETVIYYGTPDETGRRECWRSTHYGRQPLTAEGCLLSISTTPHLAFIGPVELSP